MSFTVGLFIHLVSLLFLAAGSFGGIIVDSMFWTFWRTNPERAAAASYLNMRLALFVQISSTLMLISGVYLLWVTQGAFLGEFWMKAKIVLFVLLFLNGYLIANPTSARLEKLIPRWLRAQSAEPGDMLASKEREQCERELLQVRQRMIGFHVSESAMFLLMMVFSIFKF